MEMDANTIHQMLYALRDPAGLPFYPWAFFGVGILTFAMHFFAVAIMLGGIFVALRHLNSDNPHARRLAYAMANVSKIAVSAAIVLGVAPLLAVQVYYDPMWYTSNVLSAYWVIAFVLILIAAYTLHYVFYYRNQGNPEHAKALWSIALALGGYLLVGFIMHGLSYQTLSPEKWLSWYAPGGHIDNSGTRIHDFNFLRYGFFILWSIPVTGAYLMAYATYWASRRDQDQDYLRFVFNTGARWVLMGTPLVVVLLLAYLALLPEKLADYRTSLWALLWLVGALLPALVTLRARRHGFKCGYRPVIAAFLAMLLIAIAREMLRYAALIPYYDFMDYKVNLDLFTTSVFGFTFLVLGASTIGYLLTIAWKAGKTEGVYEASPIMHAWARFNIGLVIFWTLGYFGLMAIRSF